MNSPLSDISVVAVDLGERTIPYRDGWELQRRIHGEVVAGQRSDTLLLMEHAEVFTAGSRTQLGDRPIDGSEVIDVDRGGRITWHGPGQLVGYPIMRLPHPMDVVAHVRRLEALIIDVCQDFGVSAVQIENRSGVWIHNPEVAEDLQSASKIAAVGIRVMQGVTMHGFALNCNCDLEWSQRIVPCGIPDAGVTSLSHVIGRDIGVLDAAKVLTEHIKSEPDVPLSFSSERTHVVRSDRPA